MADRDLTRTGVASRLLRRTHPDARRTGQAGHRDRRPAASGFHCWYEGDRLGASEIHPPLDTSSGDVRAITQALADQFADDIAAHPADWHMLQPQWLADLSDERRALEAG